MGQLAFGRWGQDLRFEVLDRLLEAMTQAGHHETAVEMLVDRINSNPTELDRWKPLCLRLAMTPNLFAAGKWLTFTGKAL
jgi:hypothetical protein